MDSDEVERTAIRIYMADHPIHAWEDVNSICHDRYRTLAIAAMRWEGWVAASERLPDVGLEVEAAIRYPKDGITRCFLTREPYTMPSFRISVPGEYLSLSASYIKHWRYPTPLPPEQGGGRGDG